MLNMLKGKLTDISNNRWYWLTMIAGGLILLSVALFYQHYLEEWPCVLCIHVRLWITLLVIVGFLGLFSMGNKIVNTGAHISLVIVSVGLVERSYQLLGTEKGFVFGDCGFSLGMPAWFPIEQWLPWIYRVETSCGYTPEIIFGITMAEALMLFSVSLFLLSFSVVVAYLLSARTVK